MSSVYNKGKKEGEPMEYKYRVTVTLKNDRHIWWYENGDSSQVVRENAIQSLKDGRVDFESIEVV